MNTEERIETMLDEAESLLDSGDFEAALRLCAQVLEMDPVHPGALFVQGDALRATGQLPEAMQAYRSAALARPDHADTWSSLALVAFELLDIDACERAVHRALRQNPHAAQGWWVRAALREWKGDMAGADRALLHAAWIDPRHFPLPPALTDDDIKSLVDETVRSLPDAIRSYLTNTAVRLEHLPSQRLLSQYDPPASPLAVLGHFSGPSSLGAQGVSRASWSQVPGNIILFRRNLQRYAMDKEHLIEELRTTLLHEVGHFLGLDQHTARTALVD